MMDGWRMRTVAMLILCAQQALAVDSAGTQGYAWIRNTENPRSAALGGVTAALLDPCTAAFGNPSALAAMQSRKLDLGYRHTFEGVNSGYLVGALPLGAGALSVTLVGTGFGSLDEVRDDGEYTGRSFTPYTFGFGTTYGRSLGAWSFGATSWVLTQSIDRYRSTALALDLGAAWSSGRLTVGGALRHLGVELSALREQKEELPLSSVAGAAWHEGPMFVAMDLEYSKSGGAVIHIGGEYLHEQILSLAIGYTSLGRDQAFDPSLVDGVSAGAGLLLRPGLEFRYTASFQGDLGPGHRASMGYVFP
jgi:hypothetical protein